MAVSSMNLFKSAAKGLFNSSMPGLLTADLSAHLFGPAASPLAGQHQTLADLHPYEVTATGMEPPAITGAQMLDDVDGEVRFTSDPVIFGAPVSVSPFRYLVLAYGLPNQAPALKPLLAYADLSAGGGALEVVRQPLVFESAADGWFRLSY